MLLADGAMWTQLQARGLAGDCPELWNLDNPGAVRSIHQSYIDAGAQVILTNSLGGTEWKLARSGRAADVERLSRAAAEAALAAAHAAPHAVYVLGDVGPTGELPEPYGAHALDEFERVFAAQVAALARAGVDGILLETFSSAAEAAAAVRAARRTCALPVLACLTYSAGRRGYRTLMGESVAQATGAVAEAGADLVGSNCGLGAGAMVEVIREIRAAWAGPILAKPNAGQPRLTGDRTVFDEDAETWSRKMPLIVGAGANIVGGCCGTTPDHIARAGRLIRRGAGSETAGT